MPPEEAELLLENSNRDGKQSICWKRKKHPQPHFYCIWNLNPLGISNASFPSPAVATLPLNLLDLLLKHVLKSPLCGEKFHQQVQALQQLCRRCNSGPTRGLGEPRRWEGPSEMHSSGQEMQQHHKALGCPGPALVTSLNHQGWKRPTQSFETIQSYICCVLARPWVSKVLGQEDPDLGGRYRAEDLIPFYLSHLIHKTGIIMLANLRRLSLILCYDHQELSRKALMTWKVY